MNLKVKLLGQSVHELDVDPTTLISDLKAVLEATLNISVDRQRLIYRGRVLRDENSLQELGIDTGHTVHLVERPADGQDTRPQQAVQPGGVDLNRLLQGVFSALGGGAAAGAAGGQQQQQQQPSPPHLLQSIVDYLQQLNNPASNSSFPVMPVTSLAPGLPPASTADGQLQRSLASALQQILQELPLTPAQQALLQQAATGTEAPNLLVLLPALSELLTRTNEYVTGPFTQVISTAALRLNQAGRFSAPQADVSEMLTAVSGQLQAAAALLVELARAASAASLASQGNPIALTQNMAAVLRQSSSGGLEPAFPTLYPQTTLGASGSSRSAPAAAAAAAAGPAPGQQQQHPSGQQIAEMVASALSSSLAPVIQQVSAEVENAVRAGRSQVASGQFEVATTAARTAASNHVSTTVSRVLNVVTDAINTNVRNIEQQLQQVEQQTGREATAGDIASAVQQVLLPNLNLQPLGSVIGAAARAAASSTAAAAAAAQAAQAAQQAAAAAATAAAPAPSAPPAAAAAAVAGPSSSSGGAVGAAGSSSGTGRQQPHGLGLGLKSGALPAKRKASTTPSGATGGGASSSPAAAGEAGTSADGSAFSGAARAPGVSGSGAAHGPLTRKPTPGALRLSETGRASPHPGSPRLNPVTESAEGMEGVEQQQQRRQQQPPPPDMAALMQMMGGMLGGGAAAGGAPTSAATASMGQRASPAAAAAPLSAASAAGGGGDLSGLMQMVGGMLGGAAGGSAGGAAAGVGGGGGMAGLLQMAGQIASDPAMQPIMNNIASSLLGGGNGSAGGAGGLGSLLSGLMGMPPPGSTGAAGGGSSGSATVVVGMDDLEHELPAGTAAQWRRILEEDGRAQAGMLAKGRGALSEVYMAGAPVKRQSLASLVSGGS